VLSPRPSLVVINDPRATTDERAFAWALTALGALEMIAMLAWSWRAAKNVRALGKRGLRFTPFTTVAWWFIPFANFYMPYRAIREAWLASGDEKRPPPTLLAWWLLSWTAMIVGLVAEGSTPLTAAALGLGLAQAALFANIAWAMAKRQERRQQVAGVDRAE
jgi:hypothetical protein